MKLRMSMMIAFIMTMIKTKKMMTMTMMKTKYHEESLVLLSLLVSEAQLPARETVGEVP